MGITLNKLVLPAMLLCLSSPAAAVEFHGKSSTQLLSFNNIFNEERQTEIAQYLRISATKLDQAGNISISGYGRGTQDLSNGNGLNGRLYYLYADFNNMFDKVDLRIGRQFVNIASGTALLDGGQLNVKNVGPVRFQAFGGREVFFGLKNELSHKDDLAVGVAAAYAEKDIDAEFSWMRRWDDGNVSRDVLGAGAKYFTPWNVEFYGQTRYSLVTESFDEVTAGLKYYPTSKALFTAEYYHSYPTFDTTSIFSVFAVTRYQEGLIRYDYRFNDRASVNLGFTVQDYGYESRAYNYQIGGRFRPVKPVEMNLEVVNRHGYNGNLTGFMGDISWQAIKDLTVATGMTFDVYERPVFQDNYREYARKYWLGGKYRFNKSFTAHFRVEDSVNARYENDVQGRMNLDYSF